MPYLGQIIQIWAHGCVGSKYTSFWIKFPTQKHYYFDKCGQIFGSKISLKKFNFKIFYLDLYKVLYSIVSFL